MKTVTRHGKPTIVDIIIPEVVNWAMENRPFITIIEIEEIYFYIKGLYCPHGDKLISLMLQMAFGSLTNEKDKPVLTENKISEIIGGIKWSTLRYKSIFEFDESLLNLANGVLDLETMKLRRHSRNYYFLTKSAIKYNPDAKCPAFKEWIDGVLEQKHQDTLQEIFGYTLWPDYRAHKAFMLYGKPRAGKGLTLYILQELHGKENCAHVSLQTFATNRFATAQLYGKKINTFGDLPSAPISDTGIIKGLCGEDSFTVENKFGQPFNMYNRAKLVFSTNRIPSLSSAAQEDQGAFYNRWIIIPYEKSFLGKEDPTLREKLTTPEELSGVLNWSLEGLKRLKDNNWQFTFNVDSASLYRRASDPLVAFLEDRCEPYEGYVTKDNLVKAYNDYAKKNGLPLVPSKKAFGQKMRDQTIISVSDFFPATGDKRTEAWYGIRLKKYL